MKKMVKSKLFLSCFVAMFVLIFQTTGFASEWKPSTSIKLEIGFGAGGSTDIMGRLVAAELEKQTGWNVVVENKPGGAGVAMLSTLMNKKADGHAIGLGVNLPILINLIKRGDKLPFKIDSFDYVGTITRAENALVAKADAKFNNIEELIELAKTKKVAIAFDGMPPQMILAAVGKEAGVDFKFVKHKSGAEQIQSLLGGHVDAGCLAGAHIKYLESGDLKMITVFNKHHHSYSPDTTTLIENGFNYYMDPYFFLATPKGLPENVKNILVTALDKAINSESVEKGLYNTLHTKPHNLGTEGTYKMMTEGLNDLGKIINVVN